MTIEEISKLIGCKLTTRLILEKFGIPAQVTIEGYSEGHPEDAHDYCELNELGLDISASNTSVIESIFFYFKEGKQCKFKLSNGLGAGSSKKDVRNILGVPTISHDEDIKDFMGMPPTGGWDRYDDTIEGVFIHFEYSYKNKSVQMITVMSRNFDQEC